MSSKDISSKSPSGNDALNDKKGTKTSETNDRNSTNNTKERDELEDLVS